MSAETRVDLVELRAAAAKFSGVGDRVEEASSRLQAALSREGAAWGADEAGATFRVFPLRVVNIDAYVEDLIARETCCMIHRGGPFL